MQPEERVTFEEARRLGVGGTDWQHILNLEPYGCARHLWYEKRAAEPDYPRIPTGAMERGHKLEQFVADDTAEHFEVTLERPPSNMKRGPVPTWWIGNPDRIVVPRSSRDAVAELKTKGPFPFRDLRKKGIPLSEQYQCHHYIGLTDREECLYGALEPLDWLLHQGVIKRDNDLLEGMAAAGGEFWRRVETNDPPDRLDAADTRCRTCPYRWQCQNVLLFSAADKNYDSLDEGAITEVDDDTLRGLVIEYDEIKELADAAGKMKDTNKAAIKARLGELFDGPSKVSIDARLVYWIAYERASFDSRRLKKELPDIFERYQKKPTVVQQVRIY